MIDWIKSKAADLGFDAVGLSPTQLSAEFGEDLDRFIELGSHGSMEWLANRVHHRRSPHHLWPNAKSALVLAHNYAPSVNPLERLTDPNLGNISVYALNQDYHDVIKKRLKQLGREIHHTFGCELKVFVDTAPVMEKPLAQLAGVGWQGKHTCIVSRDYGSWLFLGVILLDVALEVDVPHVDHCGQCTRCIDICPTQAITAPYQLDARRCISYLTIEHDGPIPVEFRRAMGNRIYGCDDCLAICPWNKFAKTSQELAYQARKELEHIQLSELLMLDDAAFRTLFAKSPIKRIGRDRFIRNVLIAIGNSRNTAYLPQLHDFLHDANPVLAESASWSYIQLVNFMENQHV